MLLIPADPPFHLFRGKTTVMLIKMFVELKQWCGDNSQHMGIINEVEQS